MNTSDRDAIRRFMEAKKAGRSTGTDELRFDPVSRTFVVVSQGSAESLPIVQDEDLQAFGAASHAVI